MGQPVSQFQIVAKHPEKAAEFYQAMFGWKINQDNSLAYRTIHTDSDAGISGGIWPAPPDGHGLVQLFVQVEDVEQSITQATQLGGTVIIPPQSLPDGDEMAIFVDPEGIPFGIYKPAD